MIPVTEQPEPDDFDEKVRQPGKLWLAEHPGELRSSKFPPLWTKILDELYDAYHGICEHRVRRQLTISCRNPDIENWPMSGQTTACVAPHAIQPREHTKEFSIPLTSNPTPFISTSSRGKSTRRRMRLPTHRKQSMS